MVAASAMQTVSICKDKLESLLGHFNSLETVAHKLVKASLGYVDSLELLDKIDNVCCWYVL